MTQSNPAATVMNSTLAYMGLRNFWETFVFYPSFAMFAGIWDMYVVDRVSFNNRIALIVLIAYLLHRETLNSRISELFGRADEVSIGNSARKPR